MAKLFKLVPRNKKNEFLSGATKLRTLFSYSNAWNRKTDGVVIDPKEGSNLLFDLTACTKPKLFVCIYTKRIVFQFPPASTVTDSSICVPPLSIYVSQLTDFVSTQYSPLFHEGIEKEMGIEYAVMVTSANKYKTYRNNIRMILEEITNNTVKMEHRGVEYINGYNNTLRTPLHTNKEIVIWTDTHPNVAFRKDSRFSNQYERRTYFQLNNPDFQLSKTELEVGKPKEEYILLSDPRLEGFWKEYNPY